MYLLKLQVNFYFLLLICDCILKETYFAVQNVLFFSFLFPQINNTCQLSWFCLYRFDLIIESCAQLYNDKTALKYDFCYNHTHETENNSKKEHIQNGSYLLTNTK